MAHYAGLESCGYSPGPMFQGYDALMDPKDALGELTFIQQRLVFCNAPHENLDSYKQYATAMPTGCPSGKLSQSPTRNLRFEIVDIVSEDNADTGFAEMTQVTREVLNDDQTQQFIYDG